MRRDYLLLRYLEEQAFVDRFMSGHIRFNSLNFFWGEHDELTKTGQIDAMEGLVCPIGANSTADCSRSEGYRFCNLLCCNRLNYIQMEDTVNWHLNEDMEAFGDYVVIIKDPDEFQRRLVDAADALEYMCLCQSVEYGDKFDTTRDVFDKAEGFSYQNEWRAVLFRGLEICEPYELYIGPVDDIAAWSYTGELERELERLFREHDYVNTDCRETGNVTREEFREMING